ncbi:alpha/beta hydrolase [Leucobacter aridicollis]|uniref:alpha/beta hydrolase n=1 Tax=Leucobacter aridicollis TaxID=283878 RepID=UPI0021697016|nr:alpha/beta hydrolase [Leucobacter aridicollis]
MVRGSARVTADPARPAVAAELRAGLAELARREMPGIADASDIERYRAASAARAEPPETLRARWRLHAAERGEAVTVLTASRAPRPAALRVVFLHGGGLIAGTRYAGADLAGRFAEELELEVWTIEYPLAPAANFDAMIAAVLDVLRDATADGAPVVLAGQSAGGGLAAAAGLACRDAGVKLAGLLLACPMLDARDTVSAAQFADDASWDRRSNAVAWEAALSGSAAQPPGERADLAGLPPVFLDTGSAEVFRDSIVDFAGRLWAAGVNAELHVWDGAYHSSDFVTEDAEVSRAAHAARRSWLLGMSASAVS